MGLTRDVYGPVLYITMINGAYTKRFPSPTHNATERRWRRGPRNNRYKIQVQSIIPQQRIQTLFSDLWNMSPHVKHVGPVLCEETSLNWLRLYALNSDRVSLKTLKFASI
jgi:hypothetical protein